MYMKISTIVFLGYIFLTAVCQAADNIRIITAEQWAVPRSAETVINMPPIRETINQMQAFPGNRLLIRYPGGEEGVLWVSELRSWLVSLGISSQAMELVPGSEINQIELSVIQKSFDKNGGR
jgi:hypothetical protein